jgi:hypothetical protein
MWGWRRTKKINWTGRVRSKDVLLSVKEERNLLHKIKEGRLTGLVTSSVETVF